MTDTRISYDYTHVPTIRDFSRSDAFIRGLMGPFGSGKSSGCVMEIFRRGMAQVPSGDGLRRTKWAVIRNTYNQLRDTTIPTWMDWFPPAAFGNDWSKTEHRYVMHLGREAEIEVLFRALDRPDQIGNLLSLELTGAWVNEAREVPWAIIDALTGRVGRFPAQKDGGCTWAGIILDTNPPDDDSEWYEFFEESHPVNAELFRQPGGKSAKAENLPNLPGGYYDNLAEGKGESFVRVYVDADYGYVEDGKPIYKGMWNDQLHVAKQDLQPIPGVPLVGGWDFGLTPAVIIGQMTPRGQLRILDEVCADRLGVRRFADEDVRQVLSERYQGFDIEHIGDPSGVAKSQTDEKSAFDVMKEVGFKCSPSPSNDATSRWEAVRWFLSRLTDGEPAFLLSPRCKQLRKGFNGGYRLRRLQVSGEARYAEKADKNKYSHPHDGLQYLCQRVRGESKRVKGPLPGRASSNYNPHRWRGRQRA